MYGRWVGDSFPTISSTGVNAAVIHYHAEHANCKPIDVDAIYLCDTGGQYVDGTTDTTRTLRFGATRPSDDEKRAYTRVYARMCVCARTGMVPRVFRISPGISPDAITKPHFQCLHDACRRRPLAHFCIVTAFHPSVCVRLCAP